MRKLRILVDMDSTVVDLLGPWLRAYNESYNDDLAISDLHSFRLEGQVRPECGEKILDFLREDGWFRRLGPLPGAIDAVRRLTDRHDVFIVSNPLPSAPYSAGDKRLWLDEHMSFIPHDHVVFTAAKHLLKADVLVDDSPSFIRAYRNDWPDAFIAGISYPYNLSVAGDMDVRAEGHANPVRAWEEIYAGIREYTRIGSRYIPIKPIAAGAM